MRRLLFLIALLSSVGYAVRTLQRRVTDTEPHAVGEEPTARPHVVGPREAELMHKAASTSRRAALALAFTTLFFAGAALSAGAGDEVGKLLDDATEVTVTTESGDTTTDAAQGEPAPASPPVTESNPVSDPIPQLPPGEASPAPDPADEPAASSGAPATTAASASAVAEPVSRPAAPRARRSARPQATAQEEAEAHGGVAVIWLNRALPDPTPLALRLDRWFVYDLVRSSRQAQVDWALVLGVVRARGHGGRTPVNVWQLGALAQRLRDAGSAADERAALAAVMGSADRAGEALALARYNRALGTETLVRGLTARKDALVQRVLNDRRAEIYPGGRGDLVAGRVDVRVVALISYLAESFGQVTVTSLFSGHRLYARPGVVSAHVYGHAVDVAALGGVSIAGHQEPGGLTEQAVRSILLLPVELQPRQVISLLGLGRASFPLADHQDHIHVGY